MPQLFCLKGIRKPTIVKQNLRKAVIAGHVARNCLVI